MKNPLNGINVELKSEERAITFRKEDFHIRNLYFERCDTKKKFTTTELDEINLNQVYNQYRVAHGIPFTDEIKATREKYDLSASKMSEILGLGINQYRLYESGEMPTESIGKTIKSISDPIVFKVFVQNAQNQFSENDYSRIMRKIDSCSQCSEEELRDLFGNDRRSIYNGFAPQSVDKIKNLLLFFISKCRSVSRTKMNKLLFFSDFLCYKEFGYGISGLEYIAIDFGPVPDRWRSIYSHFDEIEENIITKDSLSWEELVSENNPDVSVFSEQELSIISLIAEKFCRTSATVLSTLSHKEKAWKENLNTRKAIDYSYGFDLKSVQLPA